VVEEELSNVNVEALVHDDAAEETVTQLFVTHFKEIACVFGFYAGAGHGAQDLSSMSKEEFRHFVHSAAILRYIQRYSY
jgi:hypothetical protein